MNLPTLLKLAAFASKDPSLLPNHLGTVDRQLREKLADNTDLLNKIAGCADIEDIEASLEAENKEITVALQAYETTAAQ